LQLFDATREQAFLLNAGNILKFKPISENEFIEISREGKDSVQFSADQAAKKSHNNLR
jgi:allophanate hydrolase subunit 1